MEKEMIDNGINKAFIESDIKKYGIVPDIFKGDALKKDGGKAPFHLLPLKDLEPLVRVYEFGCKKYEEGSWRKFEPTKENVNRMCSAMIRHIAEWQEHYQTYGGFHTDEESGLPTMAHVMWNAVELMHLERIAKEKEL